MAGLQGFADILTGAFTGAAPDREGAFNEGRLQTAQTESALNLARERRAGAIKAENENTARAGFADLLAANGIDPKQANILAGAGSAGYGNFEQLTGGVGNIQEQGFRSTLADPTAARPAQLAAAEAIQGKPVERFYQSGTGMQGSQLDPTAAPTLTPVGQATIGATQALAGQRDRTHQDTPGKPISKSVGGGLAVSMDGGATWAWSIPPRGSGVGAGQQLNALQMKTVGQLGRMERTDEIMDSQFADYTPSLYNATAGEIPAVGAYLSDPTYQSYIQAAREWISGLLRADSGAAVPETEFQRYFKTYFPQPGEGPEIRTQKAAARAHQTNLMRFSLGDVATRLPQAPPAIAAPTAAVPSPAAPVGAPVQVQTIQEAMALPPGTVFITPDGRRKVR